VRAVIAFAGLLAYAVLVGWAMVDGWRGTASSDVDGEKIKAFGTALAGALNTFGAGALGVALPNEADIAAAGADADSWWRRIVARLGRLVTSVDRKQIGARQVFPPSWFKTAQVFAVVALVIWAVGTFGSLGIWLFTDGPHPELMKSAAAIGVALIPAIMKAVLDDKAS
jgi:hypothetical protein